MARTNKHERGMIMKRQICGIMIVLLTILSFGGVSLANTIPENYSSWDVKLESAVINETAGSYDYDKEFEAAKQEAQKQREHSKNTVHQRILNSIEQETADKLVFPFKNETIAPSSISATWYYSDGIIADHGGSGIGYSEARTIGDNIFRIGSRAEIAGSYWADGLLWVNYGRHSLGTGWYRLSTAYYLTGRVIMGNLNIKLVVYDATARRIAEEKTIFSSSNGYFEDAFKSGYVNVYLENGHSYVFEFVVETEANAVGGVSMSDFTSKEFDGTQREVEWSFFRLTSF